MQPTTRNPGLLLGVMLAYAPRSVTWENKWQVGRSYRQSSARWLTSILDMTLIHAFGYIDRYIAIVFGYVYGDVDRYIAIVSSYVPCMPILIGI